jgi:parallel beta-helix repeat protein
MRMRAWFGFGLIAVLTLQAAAETVVVVKPGADAQEAVQTALIEAEPGSVVEFAEGRFELKLGLSLTVDNVTVRGKGMDKTVLVFKGQEMGSEGLMISSTGVTVEDLAIEDTSGNAIKSIGAKSITYRRVRTEWTGGPKETNGAYGLYPVESENVLIEGCVVRGASDAGIYVGQSKNIIVRNNTVEYCVAGIEIENCYGADVYENVTTKNTGGILVFDLPGLPQQGGHDVRVFRNKIENNDTTNFAPKGNIVGTVPTGTGVMIMGNRNVEVFENTIGGHGTLNCVIISYHITLKKIEDPNYYPWPRAISIHDNKFGPGGDKPAGDLGQLAAAIAGTPLPDIVWDGSIDPKIAVNGKLPEDSRIVIANNGDADFARINFVHGLIGKKEDAVSRDLAEHAGSLPKVEPIVIAGVK